MVLAAAVTTHAKPHAQQQLARVARWHGAALSASKFRRGAARQSVATSMAGFLLNFGSAAVELVTKAESAPPTSPSEKL